MADIETKLKLTAMKNSTQNAFKQAAQTIEQFTQRTAKAHKDLATSHKPGSVESIAESGRSTIGIFNWARR